MNGDGCFPLDPDVLEDRIHKLSYCTGTYVDAVWTLLYRLDPNELLQYRRSQKVYLARYMRESVHSWEHREVIELQAYFDETNELIKREQKTETS